MGNSVRHVENFVYPSGNTYTGDMRGNERHGFGTYTWADDGCTYSGQWVKNQQNGKGTMTFKNGNRYEGDFFKNNIHGVGTLTSATGETISGTFRFVRRIITTDGPQFPVGEYFLDVDVNNGAGNLVHYNGVATLHLFTGLMVLPNMADPSQSFYNAVLVLEPVPQNDKEAKEGENLAVVTAEPVQGNGVSSSNGGVKYGEFDQTYNKEVKFENPPVNPFRHIL